MLFKQCQAFEMGPDDIALAAGAAELRLAYLAGLVEVVSEHAEAGFDGVNVSLVVQVIRGFKVPYWLPIRVDGAEQLGLRGIDQANGPATDAEPQVAVVGFPALSATSFWPPIGLQGDALTFGHAVHLPAFQPSLRSPASF